MKKALMVVNPNSGKNKKIDEIKVKKIFLKYNYEIDIVYTEYKDHARKITLETNADLLISVGGDGTFNEVMNGNLDRERKVVVAHIPFGTTNDLGAMYGYTKWFYTNLNLLLNGKIKNIDICTINNRPFTYVAAFGKGVNVSYDTSSKLKKKLGYLAYALEGIAI